jgi:predicted metal-binding membrane protein
VAGVPGWDIGAAAPPAARSGTRRRLPARPPRGPATARAGTVAAAVALAAALGLAAACWVVAVRQMTGMDMGTATQPGSFGFFIAVWAAMMAAMMLPGAAPAVARAARAAGVRAVPVFAGS